MSRRKGLGSPHIRGDGQPRPPRLTSREGLREIASGCGYLAVLLLALPIVGIGVVAFYLGVNYLATITVERAFEQPIVLVLLGATLIVLAALGTFQIYRRRSLPEVTPLAVVLWGVFALFLIAMGVMALASAFSSRTDTPGF